jgi:PAS domain S-box-containing protein
MALQRKKPTKNHNSRAADVPIRRRSVPKYPDGSKSAQDSIDHKEMESALRSSEAQLSNAMKIARLGHWEYDVASDTFTFNDQLYAMLRTTAEKVGGYKMSSGDYSRRFVHPDDMSVVGDEIRKALETKDLAYSCQLEHRIIYGDGEPGIITVRIFILKDEQGHTIKTYGVNQDVTERKKTEMAMVESEERYRTLAEASHDMITVLDRQWRVEYANKFAARQLKLAPQDLIGKRLSEIFPPDTARREQSNLQKVFETGEPSYIEAPTAFGDFTIWLSTWLVPLKINGKVNSVLVVSRDISERKRAEDLLNESEKRFRTLVENAPVAIVISRNGKELYINKQFRGMMRIPDDIPSLGKLVIEYFAPERREESRERTKRRSLGLEVPPEFESVMLRSDGSQFPIHAAVSQVQLPDGPANVLFFTDITERKRAEDAVTQSEEKFSSIFHNNPVLMVISRLSDGRIVDANPAFLERMGYHRDEVIGRRSTEMDFWADPLDREKLLHMMYAPGPTAHVEARFRTRLGKIFPVLASVRHITIAGEGHILGISADITERRNVEETLRLLGHTIRSISDCVSITDKNDTILFVNDAFLKTYGYTSDELVGKSIDLIRLPGSKPAMEGIRSATLDGGWKGEIFNRKKDGTEFPVSLSTSVVKDEQGMPVALVGIAVDITERKRTEQELRRKEQQQALVLDFLPMAFYTSRATEDLATTWISKQVQSLAGYSPDMFVQDKMFWTKHLHPDDRDRVLQTLAGVFKTGSADVEYRWQCADGEYRWFRDHLTMAYDKEGNPVETVGIWLEISESKQRELILREREDKFRNLFNNAEVGMFRTRLDGSEILEFNEKYLDILGYTREEIIGTPSRNMWADNSERDKMIELLNVHDRVTDYECGMLNKQGKVRKCITSLRLYRNTGILEGSILDITERKEAEEEVKRKSEDLALLNALNAAANRGDSLQKILNILAERTKEIFQSNGATVYLASDDGKQLVLQKLSIPDDLNHRIEQFIGMKIPQIRIDLTAESVHRQILRGGKPKIINDPETIQTLIAEFAESEALRKHVPDIFSVMEMRSAIVAPLMSGETLFGMVAIARNVPFAEMDLERMAVIAENLSALLQRRTSEQDLLLSQAQLHALAGHLQSVREDERTILAREMHDELGQLLTGLKMDLSLLDKRLKNQDSAREEKWKKTKIESMNGLVDKAIDAVRGISLELRPAILDSLGLSAALDWLANDFQQKSGIVCTCSLKFDEAFDHQRSTAIFRIAQEALTNVARHSKAKQVIITLESRPGAVLLSVRDDGIGMTHEQMSDVRSLGLLGIRERAIAIGGTITIDSRLGGGTTITLEVPFSSDNGSSTTSPGI